MAEGSNYYDIRVDDVVVATDVPAEADGSVLWAVDHLPEGIHKFELRRKVKAGGWASDWSPVPLSDGKLPAPGDQKVVE